MALRGGRFAIALTMPACVVARAFDPLVILLLICLVVGPTLL